MAVYCSVLWIQQDLGKQPSKPTDDLKLSLQTIDALIKHITRQAKDRLDTRDDEQSPAVEFLSEFICPKRTRDLAPVSLADVCSGSIEHLNLRHVGRLESQLHVLYSGEECQIYRTMACLLHDSPPLLRSQGPSQMSNRDLST